MRNTFIEILIENAKNDDSIVLIVGDLGFNVVEPFAKKYPERFINAGICEQSMASIAAGMAKEGFKVFIYSKKRTSISFYTEPSVLWFNITEPIIIYIKKCKL